MGRTVIQFDKDDLDSLGIPKFDFLGLARGAYVRRAFDLIEAPPGGAPELYGSRPTTRRRSRWSRAATRSGCSRSSRGRRSPRSCTRAPSASTTSWCRWRSSAGADRRQVRAPYTNRRRGRERVAYPPSLAPLLAPILDRTQGIPIFQEQAMALSMALAGYTAAEADELRRTMGNQRKAARLAAALERLRGRMVGRGIDGETAAQLVDDLRGFANYGFPESHAWSFALIAYADGVPQGAPPGRVLRGDPQRVADGLLRARRRSCTTRGGTAWRCARPACATGAPRARSRGGRRPTLPRGVALRARDRRRARSSASRARARSARSPRSPTRCGAPRCARGGGALARAGTLAAWEPDRRRARGRRCAPWPTPSPSPRCATTARPRSARLRPARCGRASS
jgi:hypothetical protein